MRLKARRPSGVSARSRCSKALSAASVTASTRSMSVTVYSSSESASRLSSSSSGDTLSRGSVLITLCLHGRGAVCAAAPATLFAPFGGAPFTSSLACLRLLNALLLADVLDELVGELGEVGLGARRPAHRVAARVALDGDAVAADRLLDGNRNPVAIEVNELDVRVGDEIAVRLVVVRDRVAALADALDVYCHDAGPASIDRARRLAF